MAKKYIIAIFLLIFVSICVPWARNVSDGPDLPELEASAWVVYWDLAASLEEIQARGDGLRGISYFAAYFDQGANLFIPEPLSVFRAQAEESLAAEIKKESYLTVVNDLLLAEGSSLKDTALLASLLSTEAAMEDHINALLDLALEGNYSGLEIDYEAIGDNMELWEKFVVFCGALHEAAQAKGLRLRVLLEPKAPLEQLVFPEGPEYVMMCYNLHGPGSGSGPKADAAFLKKLVEKMRAVPGQKAFALASGGFDWAEGVPTQALTEKAAQELLMREKDAKARRDEHSRALTFTYRDEEGREHRVWYGDAETLDYWQSVILEAGEYRIMLWRIGGNVI